MPIAQEVHNALFEGKSVQRCLIDLLARESKDELADFPAWAERIRDEPRHVSAILLAVAIVAALLQRDFIAAGRAAVTGSAAGSRSGRRATCRASTTVAGARGPTRGYYLRQLSPPPARARDRAEAPARLVGVAAALATIGLAAVRAVLSDAPRRAGRQRADRPRLCTPARDAAAAGEPIPLRRPSWRPS